MRKRKNQKLIVPCLMALGCFAADKAQAGVSFSYVTDQSSYTGAAGSTATVSVYLLETLTGVSTDVISSPDGGLTGAGAGINFVSSTGTAASFGSGANTFTLGSGFNPSFSTVVYNQGSASNLEFTEAITPGGTTIQPTVTGSNQEILLGTLNVQVGTGSTSYVLTSLNNDTIDSDNSQLGQANGNTTTKLPSPGGEDLDVGYTGVTGANLAAGTTFTINAAASTQLISISSLVPSGYGGSALATLTVHGGNGNYTVASATLSPGTKTGYVEGLTFNPSTDKEVYALDLVGATPTQLTNIDAAINAELGASVAGSVSGVYASEFPGYNVLLTFDSQTVAPPSGNGANFLAFDLTQDSADTSGVTVGALALVPEPTSLGIFSAVAFGLLGRRRNRIVK